MAKRFQGKYKTDGFDFGDNREMVLRHCKFNAGKRFILMDLQPESKDQRGFFEGAVIPMFFF